MTDDEGGIITPREYDYGKLIYREMVLLPEWSELSAESRAHTNCLRGSTGSCSKQMRPHNAKLSSHAHQKKS